MIGAVLGYIILIVVSLGMLYAFVKTLSYMLTSIEDGDDD